MPEFVRDNAGKAFEFMVEKADEDRKAAGLGTIAESFAGERKMMIFLKDKAKENSGNTFFFLSVRRHNCIRLSQDNIKTRIKSRFSDFPNTVCLV